MPAAFHAKAIVTELCVVFVVVVGEEGAVDSSMALLQAEESFVGWRCWLGLAGCSGQEVAVTCAILTTTRSLEKQREIEGR